MKISEYSKSSGEQILQVIYKRAVLKSFVMFTLKHLRWCLFLNKVADLQLAGGLKEKTAAQMRSCVS